MKDEIDHALEIVRRALMLTPVLMEGVID